MEDVQQLQAENRRLKRAVEELSIINEITLAINSTMDLDQILDLIVNKCIARMNVEQGAVQLLQKEEKETDQNPHPLKTMVRRVDRLSKMGPYRLNAELRRWMVENEKPLLINDLTADARFARLNAAEMDIRSLLSVPLILNGRMIGLIVLFNKKQEERFTADDEQLLSIVATQSAQIIENARLAREEKELMRVQEELKTARRIQDRLLQIPIPDIPGYGLSARSESAREVGGDMYDVVTLEDNRIACCVADVSGKGTAAAILMACLQSIIRGESALGGDLAASVSRINRHLFNSTTPEKYATMFYSILDPETHELAYVNAGHNRPYLVRSGGNVETLETTGAAVGCFDHMPYRAESIFMESGDVLAIFSDGLPEAHNAEELEYQEERMLSVIRNTRFMPAQMIVEAVFSSIRTFTGEIPQFDDMTLMVVKRD